MQLYGYGEEVTKQVARKGVSCFAFEEQVFNALKKVVFSFSDDVKKTLKNFGPIKEYVPPDQKPMRKFLEQKKKHKPFYKSVEKKNPRE